MNEKKRTKYMERERNKLAHYKLISLSDIYYYFSLNNIMMIRWDDAPDMMYKIVFKIFFKWWGNKKKDLINLCVQPEFI